MPYNPLPCAMNRIRLGFGSQDSASSSSGAVSCPDTLSTGSPTSGSIVSDILDAVHAAVVGGDRHLLRRWQLVGSSSGER